MFTTDGLINIFNEYKEFAILISIALSIIISLAGVLPSIFVTGANIMFFGPIQGFVISLLGETIGGYITFTVYRLGLKSTVEKIKGRYNLIDKLLISEGAKAGTLIFEGRIIPFIPSGFVTFASAVCNVKTKIFVLATFLGKVPSLALETLISYDVINIQENYLRLGITVLALILALVINKITIKNNK